MKFYLGLFLIFVVSCHPIQEEEENEIDLQGFNWEGIKKCLMEAAPLIPEIKELIKLIKARDYKQALALALRLIQKGIKVVQKCLEQFKTRDLFAAPPKAAIVVDECLINHPGNLHPNTTITEITESIEYKKCKLEEEKKKERQKKLDECYKKCSKKRCKGFGCKISSYQRCRNKCLLQSVVITPEIIAQILK